MSLDDVEVHLIETLDDAMEFKRWLGTQEAADAIGYDTEGSGLSPERDVVRLAQVGGPVHGWAFDWNRWSGIVEDLAKNYEGHIDMWNAKYDYAMTKKMGVEIPQWKIRDGRVATHILEPTKSTALKNAADRLVDPRSSSGARILDMAIKKGGWTWATVPTDFQPYWTYGALDPVLTRRMGDIVFPRVMEDSPKAYELETGVTWVADKMERRGVRIDVQYARDKYDAFMRYCAQVEEWTQKEYGVKPGANADVVRVLQEAGWTFTKATASGAVALDKEVLESVDHPLAEAVLQRRRLQKLASTYLNHFINETDADDLIHPSINTLGFSRNENVRGGKGVRTSRMSMSEPNLQNLPAVGRAHDAAYVVRNCVVARPDHTLIMCDFDQIEMRGLAHVSNEKAMIEAFLSPGDFFLNLATMIYGTPVTDKKDKRRQVTKNSGYAKIYGAGTSKFAQTAGIPEGQAREFLDRFDRLFPGVRRFQDEVQRLAFQNRTAEGVAYVRSPLTNRRQIADQGKEYALVNYLIQGLAAELFKMKLLELDAAGLGDWLVVPVHDEIILDVPNEHVIDAVVTLEKVMNDYDLLSVPVTAGVSFAQRWGEKTDWDVELWREAIK